MKRHLLLPAAILASCNSIYYTAWEKLGWEKRDLLVSAMKSARSEQKEVGEEFQGALLQLQKLTGYRGGSLERAYNKCKGEYEGCEAQATKVRTEIRKYDKTSLAADSRAKLADKRAHFMQLSTSLHAAESSMEPLLCQFHDQVLYLKHNLNAAAIGSLRGKRI